MEQRIQQARLAAEDLECLLERSDLRLARLCPLFEGLTLINALWHQLLVVLICSNQLILCALQVLCVLLELGLCCCLVSIVHLNLLLLCCLCPLGIHHEVIISLLGCCLLSLSVSLHVGEVRQNQLKHGHDTASLVLLAGVLLAKGLHALLMSPCRTGLQALI